MSSIAARLAKAKAVGPNMNEAQTGGGGDYTPPAAGVARLRLVGYYELGEHTEQTGQYAGKKNKKVRLTFELSGKNHAPAEVDGKQIPIRMNVDLNYSLNEKAGFFKLFKRMNEAHGNNATIMAELLGKEFLGTVKHSKGKKDPTKTYADIDKDSIKKAVRLDEDDNEVPIKVDPAITELKMFIWDIATMEDWESVFIDGEYPERKNEAGEVIRKAQSKNVIQDMIRSANNFDTLPIADLLRSGTKVTAADERAMDDALGEDDTPPFVPSGEVDVDDLV